MGVVSLSLSDRSALEALASQLAQENRRLTDLLELILSELIALNTRQQHVLDELTRIKHNTERPPL